jgi:hypothetical protein
MPNRSDYVIVGAEIPGCAGQPALWGTIQPGVLVEFGGPDVNPLLCIPKGLFFTLRGDRYACHYRTQPVGARRALAEPVTPVRGRSHVLLGPASAREARRKSGT